MGLIKRRKSRRLKIGSVPVGGDAPVSIQSMTNTDTRDLESTSEQISALASAGCEIVRLAVPDADALKALPSIIENSPLPVVADIHFDYLLALGSIEAGVHALRVNPGNIGDESKLAELARAASEAGIPIRVGVNSGSIKPALLKEKLRIFPDHSEALVEAMLESALDQCRVLEKNGFMDIKVSLKSSDTAITVAACRRFAELTDYPIHLGVTEAGTLRRGDIKSAVGIGSLLLDGIGDTVRVSLTADPLEEVRSARIILESVGLRQAWPEIVSCPTCGRTRINLLELAEKVDEALEEIRLSGRKIKFRKIAVMGCAVNGPGEARDADIGMAGAKDGKIVLFRSGKTFGVYPEDEAFMKFREILLENTV